MIRAVQILGAGSWHVTPAERIELTHEERHRRRAAMRSEAGTDFLLDLPEATLLRDGDGLLLEDGRVIRVVAAPEPVSEIGGDRHLLARVAWHLGNRHVPAEIHPDRIVIARDHVLERMVEGLGARVRRMEAPFDPEPGAYAHGTTSDHHDSPHEHEHDHGTRHRHPHRH